MSKRKQTRNIIIVLAIIAVLAISFGLTSIFQSASLFQQQVNIPQYWVGKCISRAGSNIQELQVTSHTDNPTFYHCSTNGAEKALGTAFWIPIYPGITCEYSIVDSDISTVYVCKDNIINNENDLSSKCTKEQGYFKSGRSYYNINAGSSIYVDTDKLIGVAKLYVKYPNYGLEVTQSDGFVSKTTTNCLVQSLSGVNLDLHMIDLKDRLEVLPDNPFNAVTALSPAITRQAVELEDVASGNPIYIRRPGVYSLIKEAEDGFLYVDTKEFESSKIECIPGTGCSDEAKFIKLEDQSCDKFGGTVHDYAPVQGDSTQLCKYSCSGGNLKKTNDCIVIPKSCPEDKPLFDATKGECVTQHTEEEKEDSNLWIPFLIAGIGILIAVSLIFWRMRRK